MHKAMNPKQIIEATSAYFGIPVEVILNPTQKAKHIVYARHIAIYLTHKNTYLGYVEIAKSFGHKNHASVAYANNHIQFQMKYKNTKRDVAAITDNLKQK